MVKLLAKPYQQFETRSGTRYIANAYGVLADVTIGSDIVDVIESGALPLPSSQTTDYKALARTLTEKALKKYSTFEGQQTELLCVVISMLGEIADVLANTDHKSDDA